MRILINGKDAPIFFYCKECGTRFEVSISSTEESSRDRKLIVCGCPQCYYPAYSKKNVHSYEEWINERKLNEHLNK